jgi:pSer/pThr/pTyr-binding forkhead associated (FHA) protein
MPTVTIRILEGLERGRVFSNLPTPITIGREDENDIQLNDDRVSRFHAKLQSDGGKIILTDLESTNGTRVNGHAVQMHVLREGDLVSIGRCLLLFGDSVTSPAAGSIDAPTALARTGRVDDGENSLDFQMGSRDELATEQRSLFPHGAPELPEELRGIQLARLTDLLAFVHEQIGAVLNSAYETSESTQFSRSIECDWSEWQRLVALQHHLAVYIRRLGNPDT